MSKKNNAGTNNISFSYAGIVSIISGILIHVVTAVFDADSVGFKFAVYMLPFGASILGYFVYGALLSLHLPSVEEMKEQQAFNRFIKEAKKKANKISDLAKRTEMLAKIDDMESSRIKASLEKALKEGVAK